MTSQVITEQNWTFCHYKANSLKAFISFGASPDILDDSFLYMSTVLDQDQNEVFQREFNNVNDACHFINNKYSDIWDFIDARSKKSEGGCSSCAAH